MKKTDSISKSGFFCLTIMNKHKFCVIIINRVEIEACVDMECVFFWC